VRDLTNPFRQRNYRERKERHIKDLEARLSDLEQQYQLKDSENQRLRCEIVKLRMERQSGLTARRICKTVCGESA